MVDCDQKYLGGHDDVYWFLVCDRQIVDRYWLNQNMYVSDGGDSGVVVVELK